MTEVLKPEDRGTIIADLNRRLQILEASARVGLSQMRWCQSTASVAPSVYGTTEYGPAVGNTWIDDLGAAGTGYPTITMVTSSKVLMFVGCLPTDVGNAAGFRSRSVNVSVKIDAAEGYLQRPYYQANIDRMYVPMMMMSVPLPALTAGVSHTFTIGANWHDTNPAAGTLPRLGESFIFVLPLSAA